MFKKIFALLLISLFISSCGSSKSGVKNSRSSTARAKTPPRKNTATRTRTETPARGTVASSGNTTPERTEVLESTSRTVVYADVVKEYVLSFKKIAQDNMRRHGVPASITLAQGILESGAGRGTLCKTANNHFGIKCHSGWTGETVNHDDDSSQECFRKYKDPADSYNDHSLFLTSRGRYAALFELDKDDFEGWAHGLKAAGYATDPKYPDKLIGLIERFELAEYDAEVLGGARRQSTRPKPSGNVTPAKPLHPAVVADGNHMVLQGETLYSISKKHNTTVDQIIKLNGLQGNSISIGQVLKVK